jgi:hypothetical protein
VKCNGKSSVTIKTSHGKFVFSNQRFLSQTGEKQLNWLDYTQQFREGYESERLRSRCCYYANRVSYQEVARLLKDETGETLLSDQRIHAIVEEEARRLSTNTATQARTVLETDAVLPAINQAIDLTDKQTEEVLLFADGIPVKKQKEHREKSVANASSSPDAGQEEDHTRQPGSATVNTDVLLLQRAQGGFTYLMEGIDGADGDEPHLSAEELLKSTVIKEYGTRKDALNLVAITDGARNIRLFFERVFGCVIVLILDWYHLEKKVWDLMSMIAWNKEEKETHCHALLGWLWEGKVDDALTYLRTSVSPRTTKKHQELMTYLTKHTTEIIDYHARQEAGKPIGSGRMEKSVDVVIGRRQKDNGMSWSAGGSKALGLLKIHELNEQIEEPALLLAA